MRPVLWVVVQRRVGATLRGVHSAARESASVWALGERSQEGGFVPSGQAFIDCGWHVEPGLRCASAVLRVRARIPSGQDYT